jgi:glycosyltransferase involved in cell wall biosynthesis
MPLVIKRPVPVLIMARELNLGGVERDVAKIAMHLDRSRFAPHVAAYYAKGLRYEELRAAGIPVVEFPLRSLISMESLRSALKLRRYIEEHGIRIVHSYDASGVFLLPVGRIAGAPVVIGSQLSYRSILDARTQRLLRMSDHVADVVLVNCEAIRRYMIEDEGVAADRVELCYNGVVTTEFHPTTDGARPEAVASATLVIGTVCVLRQEKNLQLLEEAFARVRDLKPGMKLLFVGSGPELGKLQENAARLGITDATVFVPATREVANWLRAMDIFVLPSYSEAFSNSLLEAMACGCAVVGSRVGGTPELIGENDERGFLFESRNAEDLAKKLGLLIANDELRRDLASRAASFARENLSIEVAAQRTAAIYDKLLERKTGKKVTLAPA